MMRSLAFPANLFFAFVSENSHFRRPLITGYSANEFFRRRNAAATDVPKVKKRANWNDGSTKKS